MIRGGVVGALLGAFTGTIGLILGCVVCLVIAFATRNGAELPGVFRAWFASVDGVPQLRFLPDAGGMGLALAVWTALAAGFGAASALRPRVVPRLHDEGDPGHAGTDRDATDA